MSALADELAPGLIIAVTPDESPDSTTPAQKDLLDGVAGLAVCMAAPSATAGHLAGDAGSTGPTRAGSVISIARSTGGLSAQMIPAMSLRTQPESARRLILRHQLAAPIPFRLERRRAMAGAGFKADGQELDVATAMELLEDESQRANELNQRVNEVEFSLQLAWEEQDLALTELDTALSRLRFLERAFRELGEIPVGEPDPDDEWVPDRCCDSLVAAKESLPFLVITADEEQARELDLHEKRSIWAKKIWSALRALNDYGRMKAEARFLGDITRYREDPPSDAVPLLYEYAPKESESTTKNPTLHSIRVFPVARQVDESGKRFMEQHVKIDKGGAIAPRIHIYDDSGGGTQRIHVGYIGPHLMTSSGF